MPRTNCVIVVSIDADNTILTEFDMEVYPNLEKAKLAIKAWLDAGDPPFEPVTYKEVEAHKITDVYIGTDLMYRIFVANYHA